MTWIEATAVIFGLLCVWLTVRQNIWCWPTGLVQVALYIVIFYDAKLYSDVILHVVYVILQIYGWHHWLYGGRDRSKLPVTSLQAHGLIGWILVVAVGTAGWGWSMARFTDASVPYWDAFTTVASLVAQWLMTRKRLQSWLFWISVDIVAIGVYLHKSLIMTSGLYLIFLVLATMGFFTWRTSMDSNSNEDRADSGEIRTASQRSPISD